VPRKYLILIVLALGVIVLDQWTKYLVVGELTTRFDDRATLGERLKAMYGEPPPPGFDGLHFRSKRHIEVSPDFFRVRYAENPGAAWGMFRNLPANVRGPLFHVVSIGAVILIAYYFTKLSGTAREERWALWGLPLVLGGALGNYIDRIARSFVVDYLEAHWYDKATWPSFNVADAAICVGVGMLLVDAFVRKEKPKDTKQAEQPVSP
jgi:signal peptidase II